MISNIYILPFFASLITCLTLVGSISHIFISKLSLDLIEMNFMSPESITWEIVFSHLICLWDFVVSVLLAETSFPNSSWITPTLPDSGHMRFSIALDHSSDWVNCSSVISYLQSLLVLWNLYHNCLLLWIEICEISKGKDHCILCISNTQESVSTLLELKNGCWKYEYTIPEILYRISKGTWKWRMSCRV